MILQLHCQTLSNMLCFYKKDFILNAAFFGIYKDNRHVNKNTRCHMTLEGLSSVCAKLKPASSKNNEMREITALLEEFHNARCTLLSIRCLNFRAVSYWSEILNLHFDFVSSLTLNVSAELHIFTCGHVYVSLHWL